MVVSYVEEPGDFKVDHLCIKVKWSAYSKSIFPVYLKNPNLGLGLRNLHLDKLPK